MADTSPPRALPRPSDEDAARTARRVARAGATVRVLRNGDHAEEASALDWDQIPVDERAEFVWQLSLELHTLANPGYKYEPGLSRSIARFFRG